MNVNFDLFDSCVYAMSEFPRLHQLTFIIRLEPSSHVYMIVNRNKSTVTFLFYLIHFLVSIFISIINKSTITYDITKYQTLVDTTWNSRGKENPRI